MIGESTTFYSVALQVPAIGFMALMIVVVLRYLSTRDEAFNATLRDVASDIVEVRRECMKAIEAVTTAVSQNTEAMRAWLASIGK